ncbi:hypothetical protein DM860_010684 [Cuscuta australis]|uniref:Rhodanese domain-containing protein n=1 Tax=Cuscuta australis TaxID=267555 RepID=A0A328E3H4_9ASTE|nr:hypothetical protein DM860_010684 [Cuscuta australis]
MDALSLCFSIPPPSPHHCKTLISKPYFTPLRSSHPTRNLTSHCSNSSQTHDCKNPHLPPLAGANLSSFNLLDIHPNPHFFSLLMGLSFPLSCLASESDVPTEGISSKIDLEAILVSIDNFLTRYPFFLFGVGFIWLVVIPLTEEYLQKYKFISAINAFKKLRNDPNCQMLDIRDKRALAYLDSPNLKILNKKVLQAHFVEGKEDIFVKEVLENFREPESTTVCIIDHFDGNSLKVAEMLVKNGFKEAYAIRGGLRGNKGWQEIQESLLPLSVRVYPKKKNKEQNESGIYANQPEEEGTDSGIKRSEQISNGSATKPSELIPQTPSGVSPYSNDPALKPPSL